MGTGKTTARILAAVYLAAAFTIPPTGPPAVLGSDRAPLQQGELQHEVTVTLKLIQVYVLDTNGDPVTDLSLEDFVLYDSGRRQDITEFERHLLPGRIQDEEVLDRTRPETSRAIPPQLSRKFFFLFDLDRITLEGFKRAKEAALYFLDSQVRPGDQVGLMTYSVLRGMTLYAYLTGDFAQVRQSLEAFREVLGRPGGGVSLWGMRAQALGEYTATTGNTLTGLTREIYGEAARQRDPEVEWHEKKNHEFIQQMEEMAKGMRTIPGYKNVILFSNGFPRALYEGDTFLQRNFDRMAQEFATANSPVHTINTEGGRQYSRSAASRGDSSLKNLSQLSGGRHFPNITQHESISQDLQAMTGNYYVLGYYVGRAEDGRYHEIKVEATRPGCRVHAQSGYFNPKPFTKFTDFEKQLQLYDLAMNDMPQLQQNTPVIPLSALPCAEQDDNLVLLSRIDVPALEEVLGERAELITMIYDSSFFIHRSTRAELDKGSLQGERVIHYSVESLPPGSYVCRVVIRNLETGKGAVGRADATISEPMEEGIRLFQPLLFQPGGEAVYHRSVQDKEAREQRSLQDIFPYLGEETALLFDEMSTDRTGVMAVLRSQVKGIAEPDTALNIILIDREGRKTAVPFDVIDVNADGEYDSLLLEMTLPRVSPGIFTLEITAHDRASGSQASVSRRMTFR